MRNALIRKSLSLGLALAGLLLAVGLLPVQAADDDFKLEEGYTLLFNGKDLNGWETKKGEALEGKNEAFNKRFVVVDGNLVIDDKVKGDVVIQTKRQVAKDATLKFDFKPGPGCNNDLFFRGVKFDIKPGDVKNLKEGEWNEFEIVVAGEKAEFKCNGQSARSTATKGAGSPFGIRAEFGAIQFRRIRVKEAP
jgi:hypothetical protein